MFDTAAAGILPARSKDCHIGLCKKLDAPGQIVQWLCCRAEIIKEGFQRSHIFTQQGLCLADRGVYVVEVVKGGPAEKAGLQAGDRIVSVDGTEIASKDDLGTLMQKHAAGDTLSITIARDGQMQTVNVTLGEKTASNS